MPSKTKKIGYIMIYDLFYSLLVWTEKTAFFKKQ